MLGAIFCRGCGDKLDIDSLRPEQIQNATQKAAKNVGLIIRNAIVLAIILLVVGAIGLALLKPPYTAPTAVDDKAVEIAARRLMNKGTGLSLDFSLDETNALVRDITRLTPKAVEEAAKARAEAGQSATFIGDDIAVEFGEGGDVRFVLHGKLYGKLPLYLVVTGPVQVKSEGKGLEVVPKSVAVGRLPLFDGYTKGLVLQAYGGVTGASDDFKRVNERVLTQATGVTFSGQQVTIKK
jgi:hypothetical protein